MSYDPGTGKINGYSYTDADYDTEAYYLSFVDAKLSANDGTVKDPTSVSISGTAEAREQMNAWVQTQYTMSALHGVTAIYYVEDYEWEGFYYTGWDDYWGYDDTPYYDFFGGYWFTAPRRRIFIVAEPVYFGTSKQRLNTSAPVKAQVLSDVTAPDPQCPNSSIVRSIEYQPLDSSNRRVARYHAYEHYYSPFTGQQLLSVPNTCTGGTSIPFPNDCDLNALPFTGSFIDQLGPSCPTGTTPCGLPDVIARWNWCNRGGWNGNIFKATYRIQSNQVRVNGSANIVNTVLYP